MKLFRYLKAEAGIKTISEMRFRIGRIHELNDSSEFFADYKRNGTSLPPDRVCSLIESIKRDKTKTTGILCFSAADVSSVLMWAHYADGGRGICVEIDSGMLGLSQGSLMPINYGPIPCINVEEILDFTPEREEARLKSVGRIHYSKGDAWKYENEYRVFLSLKDSVLFIDPLSNHESYFYELKLGAIQAVYVGANAANQTLDLISYLLKKHMQNISLFKMIYDASKNALVSKELK